MIRKSVRRIAAILAAALILAAFPVILAGCADDDGDAIWIGAIMPLSGDLAFFGNDMLNAYRLAVEEINAAGGILGREVRLFHADDEGNSARALPAAQRIISRGVDFVAGGYASGVIIPTMQLFYDENLLLLISNANSTDITAAGFNQSFMINSPATHQVAALERVLRHVGARNIALIHQGCAFTQNLANLVTANLPGEFSIATTQVMPRGEQDVSAIVTAIVNSGADFVYWCGYYSDGANVIRQLRRGGFDGVIAVSDGSASVRLIEFSGPDGEGVYVTSPPDPQFISGGEEFIEAFRAMFNTEPGPFAALSYDTIHLLAAAVEAAGTTETAAVRDAVQNIEFSGLSGTIRFTPDREPEISNFIIMQIRDGAFVLVD